MSNHTLTEDITGDLDEKGIELALVPLAEDLAHLLGGHAQTLAHEVVGFAAQLHIAVPSSGTQAEVRGGGGISKTRLNVLVTGKRKTSCCCWYSVG